MLACLGALITSLTIYAIVYIAKVIFGHPVEEIHKVQQEELEMKARKIKRGEVGASDNEELPMQYNLNVQFNMIANTNTKL